MLWLLLSTFALADAHTNVAFIESQTETNLKNT